MFLEHALAKDDLKTTTIRSLFWKLFEQGGTAVVTLVVQIVMARLLSPDDFGALAIMLVFVNIGNVIVQSGLNTAIIQAPDADENDYSTVFWMSLSMSCVLYAALFFAAPAIAAIGAAEGDELLPTEMRRTGTAVPRTGENLHVVYKVRTSHITSI